MAKFLTTTGMSAALEEIIKSAKQRVVLISPYLKLNDRLRGLLEDRDRLQIDLRIVYGKSDLHPEEMARLRQMRMLKLYFLKNLHAKCYLSEEQALIGSMNLYEFSQVNNEEMGILVQKAVEPDLYESIREEAERLIRMSEYVEVTIERAKPKPEAPKEAPARSKKRVEQTDDEGFCIRCAESIPLNPEKPYCADHYREWSKWKNADYKDEFCHGCGDATGATLNKPLCRDCFKTI